MKRIPRPQRFAAVGLWTLAGNWCASELTDGAFPEWMLEEIGGTPEQAQALVEVGLWDLTDEGWLFHDWLDYQPSRETVLARRSAGASRVALFRDHDLRAAIRARDGDRCRYCAITVQWTNRRGPEGGTYDHVIPGAANTVDSLVVSCRGCNSAKGSRTPEAAGMTLLPAPGSKSGVRSDLDRTQDGSGNASVSAKRPVPVPVPKEEPSSELPLRPAERPDIDRICTHLADRIQANGSKRPTITARWRDSARLMLDADHRAEAKVHRAIDWCQDDEFWRANVLSMATLREKYDQLRLAAERKGTGNGARTDERTPSYWAKERT